MQNPPSSYRDAACDESYNDSLGPTQCSTNLLNAAATPRLYLAEYHALSIVSRSMWWCDAGKVQISLIAEAVLWTRGILVMPPIVNQLVKAMQVSPALSDLSANVMLCQSSRTA